ncbi:MAG: molecular chaperone DnaJ [Chloroflexota bacterium]|nr:molecular chaperone DnaJ [Chloroflexota bacterium]
MFAGDLPDLTQVLARLRTVRHPEEVFGDLSGDARTMTDEGRRRYHRLAHVVHPDTRYGSADNADATEATALLNYWWERARAKITAGLYGRVGEAVLVQTRTREYTVTDLLAKGDKSSLYHAAFTLDGTTRRGIFKVARHADDNDLIENEARTLRALAEADTDGKFGAFFPSLIESMNYAERGTAARRANVLAYDPAVALPTDLVTLKGVRAAYPGGIDPRDMAWMWRRVLTALGYAHKHGVIHGAILPTHILIQPALHGLILIDWGYAVTIEANAALTAISADYEAWYPREVFDKQPPLSGHDIYMGARCMVELVGGDGASKTMPASMPDVLRRYFAWCMTEGARLRPQDAWTLRDEFDTVLERLYGARRFRAFTMPTT